MAATVRSPVRTVVVGERPPELEELIERRKRFGVDGHDEMWEGEFHMAPLPHPWHAFMEHRIASALEAPTARRGLVTTAAFNLGDGPENYRGPDAGVHASLPDSAYVATALLVVEILSPGDESYAKFDFYASRGVREIVIVDPRERMLQWWSLDAGGRAYGLVHRSEVLDIAVSDIAAALTWPG